MSVKKMPKTIEIDDKKYRLDQLSERAQNLIRSLTFCDERLQQLSNNWAVADTARIGYTNALRNERGD